MSDVPAGTKKAVDFDAVQAIKEAWETSPPRRKVRVYIGLVDSGRRSVLINPPGSLDSDTCCLEARSGPSNEAMSKKTLLAFVLWCRTCMSTQPLFSSSTAI